MDIAALHLPDFDPSVSSVTWFRDFAAYCGLSSGGKQLYAVVAQIAGRKPLLMKKISAWDPGDHPSPACGPAWHIATWAEASRTAAIEADLADLRSAPSRGF